MDASGREFERANAGCPAAGAACPTSGGTVSYALYHDLIQAIVSALEEIGRASCRERV